MGSAPGCVEEDVGIVSGAQWLGNRTLLRDDRGSNPSAAEA